MKTFLILSLSIFVLTQAVFYNMRNGTKLFRTFKIKYNKTYENSEEEENRFENFIYNLNTIAELNENSSVPNIKYHLNRYADENPREIEEHFAISLKPYYNTTEKINTKQLRIMNTGKQYPVRFNWLDKPHPFKINESVTIRVPVLREKEDFGLDRLQLYDLNDAEELYNEFLEKHKEKSYKKKLNRTIHFYRFVKTLVDINRSKFEGKNVEIDDNADVLQSPNDYYF